MFSNLAFVWLGYQTPSAEALTVAIVVENFSGAIGTVIFVAYLSALCRNPLHTATQYALLTALASTGRTLFSSGTGFAGAGARLAAVLHRHVADRDPGAAAADVAARARTFPRPRYRA